jgi:hypothetical protein
MVLLRLLGRLLRIAWPVVLAVLGIAYLFWLVIR